MSTAAHVAREGSNSAEALRAQVAACTRLLNMLGILHYSGHISVRVPGTDTLFIQTREEGRGDVTPGSVLRVDLDGNVIEGAPGEPPSELVIHTEIYRARPDAGAVIHNHMELPAAFTMVKGARLEIMSFHAARWAGGIPVHRDTGHIKSRADGASLAKSLGDRNALLLRAHGVVLVSESAPAILIDTLHFDDNARAQKEALALGGELDPLTPEELARVHEYEDRTHHIRKMWNYYVGEGRKAGVLPEGWDVAL
ncbi:MAG TPA: class II aldolase/adducin family protein [Alphaproteobacteria bacterium]